MLIKNGLTSPFYPFLKCASSKVVDFLLSSLPEISDYCEKWKTEVWRLEWRSKKLAHMGRKSLGLLGDKAANK